MKKYLFIILILLLSVVEQGCKITNLEPTPSTELAQKNTTLKETVPLKMVDNVYTMKLAPNAKIVKFTATEIDILGDVTFTNSKNLRIRADTPPKGSFVSFVLDDATGGMIEIKDGVKIGGHVKITYAQANYSDAIVSGAIQYSTTLDINLKLELEEKRWPDVDEILMYWFFDLGGKITYTTIQKFEDRKMVYYSDKLEIDCPKNEFTFGVKGEIKRIARSILKKHKFATKQFLLGGIPIFITPTVQFGLRMDAECAVDFRKTFSYNNFKYATGKEWVGNRWNDLDFSAENKKGNLVINTGVAAFSGEAKFGPEIVVLLEFYKWPDDILDKIDNNETFDVRSVKNLNAGEIIGTFFPYTGIKLGCETGSGGPNAFLAGVKASGKININLYGLTSLHKEIEEVDVEFTKSLILENSSGVFNALGVTLETNCDFIALDEDLTLVQFRDALKNNRRLKFPVYEGTTVANFDGSYELSPALLDVSTFDNDPDTKKVIGSALIKILNTVNNKSLEIWQYKTDATLPFDYQKNESLSSAKWILRGAGNKFTIVTECTVRVDNEAIYTNYVAIFAEIEANGNLKDMHYAYYRKKNLKQFEGIFPEGKIRVFKDKDGISAKRSDS